VLKSVVHFKKFIQTASGKNSGNEFFKKQKERNR
jgi:hypothetical protein